MSILVNILLTLFLLFLIVVPIAIQYNAIFIVSLLKGGMIGTLYDVRDYPEENISETTIQFCFIWVTITIKWEKTIE